MECQVAAFSRVGGRERNEDACGYVEKNGGVCCVLADGAGGHQGGDVASRLCVQSVLEQFGAQPEVSVTTISSLLHNANQAVLRQQQSDAAISDMRSTLVVLLFDPVQRLAVWGHIGDSRLYLFRNGTILLRTQDHSLVQSMVDSGLVKPEDAHAYAQSNILIASIGLQDGFLPSVLESPFQLHDGDAMLLCSDGIWGIVEDKVLEQCLSRSTSPADWLNRVEQEMSRHLQIGSDNYTAVGVWCRAEGDFLRTMPA